MVELERTFSNRQRPPRDDESAILLLQRLSVLIQRFNAVAIQVRSYTH